METSCILDLTYNLTVISFFINYFCVMKKIFLFLLIASVAVFSACEQDGVSVSFDVDYDTDFTVESALITDVGVPVEVNSPSVNTNKSEIFTSNSTQIDKVEKAEITALSLTIVAPEGQTFSFLNEVNLYIKGQGQSEELIASKTNVDSTSNTLVMDVESTDLAVHVKSGEFTMRANVTTNELVSEDVEVNAAITMKITAKAL